MLTSFPGIIPRQRRTTKINFLFNNVFALFFFFCFFLQNHDFLNLDVLFCLFSFTDNAGNYHDNRQGSQIWSSSSKHVIEPGSKHEHRWKDIVCFTARWTYLCLWQNISFSFQLQRFLIDIFYIIFKNFIVIKIMFSEKQTVLSYTISRVKKFCTFFSLKSS